MNEPQEEIVTPVELVIKNEDLTKENYELKKKFSTRIIWIFAASLAGNVFLFYLAFFYFPKKEYVATTNTAAICSIPPVSKPAIHHRTVADFALDSVIGIYSFDHVNYKRQISSAVNEYFTPTYRDQFMVAFGDSPNLQTVIDNFYVVTATAAGRPPQIIKTGQKGGVYFWNVQVPVNVYYTSGRKIQEEKLLAEVTVVRTEPSRLNPRGIAVSGINTRQLLK